LVAEFGLSAFVFAVELVGALASKSLALLADAGHVLTDLAGVGLSLLAIWFAARPSSGGSSVDVRAPSEPRGPSSRTGPPELLLGVGADE
jgi:hypothetical protein